MTPLRWGAAFLGLCAVLALCAAVIAAVLALLVLTSGEAGFAFRAGALAAVLTALGATGGVVARRLWKEST